MLKKQMSLIAFFMLSALITQSLTIYLPENETINRLNNTAQKQQQKQHQQLLHESNKSKNSAARLPHKSYDINDDVVDDIHHNGDEVNNEVVLLPNEGGLFALQYHREENNDDTDKLFASHVGNARKRRELSDWLIAPNTHWCGRGNTANGTYNHLGGASAADKCCRKHDHCQVYIPAMSNRYELFNYRPYTLSHCNCDRRFRTCLKMANDEIANTIGKFFFNMVQTQCFALRHEKVCQQRAADGSCERELTKQKAYLKNNRKF